MKKKFSNQQSNFSRFQNIFKQQFHKVITKSIQNTIAEFIVNYKNKKYQINEIMIQSQKNLQDSLNPQIPNGRKLFQQFFTEYSIFFWNLSISAGIWIQMLNDQEMTSQTNIIDLYNFLLKIYNRFLEKGSKHSSYFVKLSEYIQKEILFFLQIVSEQVAHIFNINRKLIIEQIDEMNSQAKQLRLMNKYIIYKLLRELSNDCYYKIKSNLEFSIFMNVEPHLIEIFTNFIIQKHQTISLENLNLHLYQQPKSKKKILEDQFVEKLVYLSSNLKRIEYRQAIRQDGKKALHITVQQNAEKDNIKNYLVQIDNEDQLVFMNCDLMTKKWRFSTIKQQNNNIQKLINQRKSFLSTLRNAPTAVEKITLFQNINSIGGSLGTCLANLKNYDSISSFAVDFSQKAIITTSLNYLVQTIPMIGYFLVAGGFTYTFYHLAKNNFKNDKAKFQEIGKVAFSTSSSFGASLMGAFVGNALIPIPIIGMFVGSVVGGFFGGLTGDVLVKYFQSKKFQQICVNIDKMINPNGSWTISKKMLGVLGVNKQFFYDNIPPILENRVGCDNVWLTIICFILLSFYESSKKAKQMEQILKYEQENGQYEMKQDIQYISINLECSLNYLQKEKIEIRMLLNHIQAFLQKMFQRI